MALVDQIEISTVWTDSGVRGTNDVGTPIVSAEFSGSGEEISDEYTLVISSRSGSTGTVTVSASTPNNPYHGRVTTGVTFDDATANTDVVPGVSIVFDDAAVDADEATIAVGDYKGTFDASGVGAGVPTAEVRHKVVNDGANAVSEAKARLVTQSIHIRKTGSVFSYVSPFAEDAVEKTAGGGSDRTMPYAMSISNVSGSGSSKVADLSIDGVPFATDSIQDLSDGTFNDGTGLKAIDPPHHYLVVDGDLQGLEFAIHADCVNGDTANIMIFPSRFVQIASDSGGSPGTYGTTDVNLTESGESTGVITPSGEAYYWTRLLVPASSNNESNPYPCNVALQVSESQDAGWAE